MNLREIARSVLWHKCSPPGDHSAIARDFGTASCDHRRRARSRNPTISRRQCRLPANPTASCQLQRRLPVAGCLDHARQPVGQQLAYGEPIACPSIEPMPFRSGRSDCGHCRARTAARSGVWRCAVSRRSLGTEPQSTVSKMPALRRRRSPSPSPSNARHPPTRSARRVAIHPHGRLGLSTLARPIGTAVGGKTSMGHGGQPGWQPRHRPSTNISIGTKP